MIKDFSLQEATYQIRDCYNSMKEVFPFIKDNQLWKGLRRHKWISLLTLISSILITYILVCNCIDFFSAGSLEKGVVDIKLGEEIDEEKISKLKEAGKSLLLTGGWKYLFLIVFEVVIFFFATQTLGILKDIKISPTFKQFLQAERRMIKVMIRNFITAILISIPIHIVFGILSMDSLIHITMFFIHAYFIGLAFLDNYYEQFEINIKESSNRIYNHRYASTFLGVVISLMLYIPLIGPLITPLFGAIAATLYGHKNRLEHLQEELD